MRVEIFEKDIFTEFIFVVKNQIRKNKLHKMIDFSLVLKCYHYKESNTVVSIQISVIVTLMAKINPANYVSFGVPAKINSPGIFSLGSFFTLESDLLIWKESTEF